MDAIKVKLIGLSRGGGGNLQPDKTVTPTEQEQTVRADPGYDGLRQVTVEAIPDQYADVSGVDAGAGDVRIGKVIVGSEGEAITGTMPPQKPEEIGHATPTEQAQTVTPTAGSVFSAVEVDAIPTEYADVSSVDATAADVRTGKVIVDASGEEITGVMEPQKPEQVKSATPTTTPQSVVPDTGYALSRVDVGAIPSEYADVSDVTATAETVLTGSDFVDASGALVHGACDYDADTSDADATAGQIEAGATAYVDGAKITGTMPIRTTDVEISDLSPVPIPAGSYDGTASAKLSSAAAAEVVASNIRQGAEILGVQGSYEGVDTLAAYLNDTLTTFDFSSDTTLLNRFFCGKRSLEYLRMPNVTTLPGTVCLDAVNLKSVDFSSVTMITNSDNFCGCTSLETVNLSGLVSIQSYGTFAGCASLKRISLPSIESISAGTTSGQFRNSGIEIIDLGENILTIGGNSFRGSTKFKILIIRANTIPTLGDINAFSYTPFTSGGTGGTLYIKKSLYDHLGDGTADDYLSATNWSVVFSANHNNQILPIEGSPYEVTT